MVRTVCLNEDKHAVTMLRGLKQMKHEDHFCDFTIKVKGIEIPVHRNIIAVASPYFKAMLKHDTVESQQRKAEMKDVDFECVKNCIDFMYSGKFDIPDGKTGELLHVAIMMQLDNIKEAICKILDEELKAENFYQTITVAETYQLPAILAKCKTYYQNNFIEISAQSEFQNESKSHLMNVLKSKRLKLSEDDELAVCIRWVGNDPEKKESLLDLLKHINLKKVTPSYLNDLLQNHPVITNDLRLYKMCNQPLLGHVDQRSKREKREDEMLVLFDKDADCLRSYNPSTNEVAEFHDEKFKHLLFFTAIPMESYIYVLCKDKSVHRLDIKDRHSKWERMQDMIADHGFTAPSLAHSGSLYVIGSHNTLAANVERFIPEDNKWSRLPKKPSAVKLPKKPFAVKLPTLVSLDDSIYCIGGWDGSKDVKTFCKFTPSTSRWADLEPMKTAKSLCGAVAVERKIFVMGGRCRFVTTNEVECYDVSLGQWTSLSPMIEGHFWNLAHHVNGFIFCVFRDKSSDKVVKYDIANDKWSKVQFKGQSSFTICNCCMIKCD